MALPEVFQRIYLENEETVRERLLASMPDKWATVEGSWSRDMLETDVLEFTRIWDELNRYLSYTFIQYAYGSLLDAHGQSYGCPRKTGTQATGIVRFTAPEGTAIPPGTLVGVPTSNPDEPRAAYQTTNVTSAIVPAAGYVDVPIISLEAGAAQNQAAGTIVLLETPTVEVEAVTNPGPTTGGSDPETDSEYRVRLTQEATLSVGSGTLADYISWSLEKPGVADVAVKPLWDTSGVTPGVYDGRQNGSVLVSLRGPSFVAVDWSILEEVQKYIDPSRQVVVLLEEGEPWTLTAGEHTTLDWEKNEQQAGATALRLVTGAADTAVASVVRTMDLSRFVASDSFYLWIKSSAWGNVSSTTSVRLYTDEGDYFSATLATISASGGTAKPSSGSEWWLWRVDKGQFSETGAPDWSAITKVEIRQVTTGAATQYYDYWSIRDPIGAVGSGRAPVGASVTVITPVPLEIGVKLQLVPLPGYTVSGAPGTSNLTELLTASINAYFRTLKPGEPILISKLENAINDTPGISDFLLEEPGAATTTSESTTLPAATIKVASTTGFLSAGSFYLGNQLVNYTGKTGTSFTGCTLGAGTWAADTVIMQTSIPVVMSRYVTLGSLTITT